MQNIPIFQTPIRKQKPKLINSIIALGNPIVDFSAEIDESDIQKYGLKKGEVAFVTNENKGFYLEIEQKLQVFSTIGGSALNILRAISWGLRNSSMDLSAEKKISMLGCVGNDILKNKIINTLQQSNIKTNLLEQIDMATSRCAVGICNNKDRYFLSDILASRNLSVNFIQNHWNEIISHDALLIEGYFIKENFDLCSNICDAFIKAGKFIILTLSDPLMIESYKEDIIKIANKADMVVGSLNAAKKLVGEINDSTNIDLLFKKIYSILNDKNRILIITAGNHGVFCSKYDSTTKTEDHFQTFPNQINNRDIVDFNGAGDAFLGGFISQQMQNKTFEDCCHLGNKAAAVVIKNIGCNFQNSIIRN